MDYFSGIVWKSADHVERCGAWIDRHFPDNYALNFAHAGRIRFAVDGAPLVILSAPVAWWTSPGPRYTYGTIGGETWDHYYVSFEGPRAESMVSRGLLQCAPACHTPVYHAERFRQHFEDLLTALRERPGDNPRAVALLEGLLLQTHDQENDTGVADMPFEERIRALMCRLRDDPEHFYDWHKEARNMGVSEVHFRRLFRHFAGLPPRRFAIQAALDASARMLQTTAIPVKAVASQVGYDDIQHFTRMFGRRFGVPPATYRNEMQAGPP